MPRSARSGVSSPQPDGLAEMRAAALRYRDNLLKQVATYDGIIKNLDAAMAGQGDRGIRDLPPVIPGQYAGMRTGPALEASPGERPQTDIAKLFPNGRSQAVRLPREFRFKGDRVRVRRVARGVLLEPIIQDAKEWFAKLAELNFEPFLSSRNQPPTPKREVFK